MKYYITIFKEREREGESRREREGFRLYIDIYRRIWHENAIEINGRVDISKSRLIPILRFLCLSMRDIPTFQTNVSFSSESLFLSPLQTFLFNSGILILVVYIIYNKQSISDTK